MVNEWEDLSKHPSLTSEILAIPAVDSNVALQSLTLVIDSKSLFL